MIEALVGALLLSILAVGLLSGFDFASRSSGTNKARAVAASIAQDDQERMRGLEVRTLLLRGPEMRTVKAGAGTYSVKSTAEAMTDSIEEGCTAGSTGVDYLKLHSEVTWHGMTTTPVTSDSLMAPRVGSYGPNEGGMSVQLIDRDADPLEGIGVTLGGATSFNDTTDENGCAFFAYIPAADYTIKFSVNGYVTPGGVQDVAEPVSVPVGAVGNKIISYDQAGDLKVTVQTKLKGVLQADVGTSLVAAHPNIPAPGAQFFHVGTPAAQIDTGYRLFPFPSPYSAFAGDDCMDSDPGGFSGAAPTATIDRAATTSVNILEPAINVVVKSNGVKQPNALVRFYGVSCAGTWPDEFTNAEGRLAFPGKPFGDYDVCAQYPTTGSTSSRRWKEVTDIKNQSEDGASGGADIVIDVKGSGSKSGSNCPTS